MQVGLRARVMKLERPTEQDREKFVEQDGLLVRRLNVAWEPGYGGLWQLRFDSGEEAVFAESELALVGPDDELIPPDMDELRESWGRAPRTVSMPFRRFGAGVGAAPAMLAFVIFVVAGILLIWAGISAGSALLGGAGAALILLAIAAVAVLVT